MQPSLQPSQQQMQNMQPPLNLSQQQGQQNQQQCRPPSFTNQQNYQIHITSKGTSCCCSFPKQSFDFTFLNQDPRLSALGLNTECLTTFNQKYQKHVVKTRFCSWGIIIIFLVVATVNYYFDIEARVDQKTVPEHFKCNPGVVISPLSYYYPNNITDLWCCDKALDPASTLVQVREAFCLPMGGAQRVDTVDLNLKWKASSVAVACKLELKMGLSNSCLLVKDITMRNCELECQEDSCKCAGNVFALLSSTRINYNEAFKQYNSVLDNVITATMAVLYVGSMIMSCVIPCCNKKQLDRLLVTSFTPWMQRCSGSMTCNLQTTGYCGNAYCNGQATLTLQFPYVQLPLQLQQQQGIGGMNRPITGTLLQITPIQSQHLLQQQQQQQQNPNALNSPGIWDVFISHTQRNPEGKLMALDLHSTLATMGKTSWLDVKMNNMSMDAMREGVQNSSCVIAVITDACITADDDPNKGGPEQNMYFNRWMCIQELKWAIEAGVPIQPVIRAEDKKKIGDFIQMAPEEFKYLGGVDWKHLDRSNKRYFALGVEMVLEGVQDLLAQKRLLEERLTSTEGTDVAVAGGGEKKE